MHCLSTSRLVASVESASRHRSSYKALFFSAGMLITIFSHLTIILCGIHPTRCPLHTLLSALYVAFNTLLPATRSFAGESQPSPVTESLASRTFSRFQGVSTYLLGPPNRRFDERDLFVQLVNQFATQCSIIGIVASSILRVLDHGLQCQRYPIPILYGFIYGRLAGVTLGFIWISACSDHRLKPR